MSISDKYPLSRHSRPRQSSEPSLDTDTAATMDTHNVSELGFASVTKHRRLRNLIAFWFLGLSNNFAYVVMLSAAHDILEEETTQDNNTTPPLPIGSTLAPSLSNDSSYLLCNPIGTGTVTSIFKSFAVVTDVVHICEFSMMIMFPFNLVHVYILLLGVLHRFRAVVVGGLLLFVVVSLLHLHTSFLGVHFSCGWLIIHLFKVHIFYILPTYTDRYTAASRFTVVLCYTLQYWLQAVLLADILPALIVKITAPLYIEYITYRIKVSLVILFALGSFIIVGFANSVWLSILGVVCASISAGLGEPTFLGLSTFFDRNVVSTWSSGTGGAGVFGALSYAGLTSLGASPRTTVLIMTVVPVIMAISYFVVLVKPPGVFGRQSADDTETLLTSKHKAARGPLSWRQKIHLTKPLLQFMVPLGIVYFAEYFINQGLHELLYFNDVWLSPKEQYRWYQLDYQVGVFISRSSVNIFRIHKIWILPILQVVNMVLLLTQVFYHFIPSIWIIFAIVLYEGLLGGGAYVNTFYKMSEDIPSEYREYSLSVASIADSAGIAVAGSVAIPVHNKICSLNLLL